MNSMCGESQRMERGSLPSRTFIKDENVLVVGGGAWGMEAARISGFIGHNVTLWEKEDKLGWSVKSSRYSSR